MAAAMYCRCTCEFGYNDGKEIDLVFDQNQTMYPLEVKLGATARRNWVRVFSVLERLGKPVGEGGVICLCDELMPLSRRATAIPVGVI